jgi:hypothetical protein
VQLAATDPPPPIVPELHDAMPERLSLPDAWKSTGRLYQPFESGPRESERLTAGGVASYLKENEPPLAEFPALSVQDPEKLPLPVSGPPYVRELHDAN